jgi:hypothetical protein
MSADNASLDFEPAIWARLIEAPKAPISLEAARYLISIGFGDADRARMEELMEKSNEGTLTPEEMAELEGYVNIANVLSVLHSRARVALHEPGFESMRNALKLLTQNLIRRVWERAAGRCEYCRFGNSGVKV